MAATLRRVYTDAEQELIDRFEPLLECLPGNSNVIDLRQAAIASFRDSGLPHRRVEEWKYTDLRGKMQTSFPAPSHGATGEIPRQRFLKGGFPSVVFENGRLTGDLPSIDGLSITPLRTALTERWDDVKPLIAIEPARGRNPVFDLNAAYMDHGLWIEVADGVTIDEPLHVRSLITNETPASYFGRIVLKVGKGASFTLIEGFRGSTAAFQRNATIQIEIGDGATLTHVRIEDETDEAFHLANVIAKIGAEATYKKFGMSIGAAVMQNDLSIQFEGEHANAEVASIFLKSGKQHHDTTMYVDHAVPNCTSRELFKAVLGGEARGVFQGKILVRPHAQKTDGEMSANAIMLSDQAEMDAKPELEIYADDVVCGHGATAGELDEDLLFFLKSRGIPEIEAKALLIEAFIGEAFDELENETIRDAIIEMSREWIAGAEL
ncbi:MAG: Fe-S cluster assembly protein SufD [Pseudomonadota bacterium]